MPKTVTLNDVSVLSINVGVNSPTDFTVTITYDLLEESTGTPMSRVSKQFGSAANAVALKLPTALETNFTSLLTNTRNRLITHEGLS